MQTLIKIKSIARNKQMRGKGKGEQEGRVTGKDGGRGKGKETTKRRERERYDLVHLNRQTLGDVSGKPALWGRVGGWCCRGRELEGG